MVVAFQKFNEINKLPDCVEKHRAWLLDYEGKKFSIALEGVDLIKWKNTKYSSKEFDVGINKVGELANRLRIEFDGDENEAKKFLEETYSRLKELKFGFIRSTHCGKSDYLWIEFTRNLNTKEKQNFLKWIAPENSEVDLNFASPNFCFPVLWAIHWKHSDYREMPIEYFEGEQIDYDKLEIKNVKGRIKITEQDGFNYKTFKIFSRQGQAQVFFEEQPFFYDKGGLWWFWNKDNFKWEIFDEVDILNFIEETRGVDIITSKSRSEILNSLKQEGRKNIPRPVKPTWIQFQDTIYDIETNEHFKATPDYFITNPIPWEVSNSPDTPVMDKIFEEWVGKDHVQTLYEIIAYCCLCDYPINRLFCFVGAGMNGKSCFLNLLRKFIGTSNVCTTELDLLLSSRFEVTKLHKKLVCMMGETNFNEMQNTSILKRLTGGDLIGFEYKNKNPFEDMNYAKIIIATNNLPTTTDKTVGFYRRWLIIDFPNAFSEVKDILKDIPEKEYSNLAMKSLMYLNYLITKRGFTNEGSVEERTKKFEDRSNPLDKFIKEYCNLDNPDGYIFKYDFEKKFNQWCKDNRFRNFSEIAIGKEMKERGFVQMHRNAFWLNEGKGGMLRAWIGINWF